MRHPKTIHEAIVAINYTERWNAECAPNERHYVMLTNALMLDICQAIQVLRERVNDLEAMRDE